MKMAKLLAATMLLVLALTGCVERELAISSDPSGAMVRLSDKEIGRTPVTQSFTHYGDYDIVLRLEGHETLKTHADINAPWYEWPVLDFISEVLPWTIHDRRYLHYTLPKAAEPTDQQLLQSAEQLKAYNAQPVPR
jgi:hypothetical protein